MEIYLTSYKVYDPFTANLDMGAPAQLNRKQENSLKSLSNGEPIEQQIIKISNNIFLKEFKVRDKDVYLVKL